MADRRGVAPLRTSVGSTDTKVLPLSLDHELRTVNLLLIRDETRAFSQRNPRLLAHKHTARATPLHVGRILMLTSEQIAHFNAFGFLVLREVLAPQEVETIHREASLHGRAGGR